MGVAGMAQHHLPPLLALPRAAALHSTQVRMMKKKKMMMIIIIIINKYHRLNGHDDHDDHEAHDDHIVMTHRCWH
jgi:hypothetical protein